MMWQDDYGPRERRPAIDTWAEKGEVAGRGAPRDIHAALHCVQVTRAGAEVDIEMMIDRSHAQEQYPKKKRQAALTKGGFVFGRYWMTRREAF